MSDDSTKPTSRQKQALDLKKAGLTNVEVAKAMGISHWSVSALLSRADRKRKKARERRRANTTE